MIIPVLQYIFSSRWLMKETSLRITEESQRGDNQPPITQNPGSSDQKKIVEDATSPDLTRDTGFIRATQDPTPSVEHNIVYNDEGQVKGGTLDALVERLTSPSTIDLAFTQTFLLTFKTFTTAEEFFDKLVRRYAPSNI
jgi:hypothetical protein